MLEALRKRLLELLDQRSAEQAKIDQIVAAADAEARSDLTDDESKAFAEARAALTTADAEITQVQSRISDLEQLDEARTKAEAITVPAVEHSSPARVKSQAPTYRKGGEHDFLVDAYLATFKGSPEARERIERNRSEVLDSVELRSTTGAYGSLVVPQYLTDMYAQVLKAGRPFLNAVTNLPLPDSGMTIYIPRGATGTLTAAQATQNTSVTNQTLTESDLTISVNTYAGQQVTSRQAIDRGTGIADILMSDLVRDYATRTNVDAINGAGSSGTHWGILNTTSVQTAAWTGTTGASLVASIHNAIGKVNTLRYAAPDLIVMHPRRWAWLCAQSDTSNRPLVQIDGPGFNAVGNGAAAGYGRMGSIAGVSVLTDAGVPVTLGASTNEDRVIVTRTDDVYFWEGAGAPAELRFEEVLGDQLTVRLVTFGYSAFSAGRWPVATAVISGTGFTQVLT